MLLKLFLLLLIFFSFVPDLYALYGDKRIVHDIMIFGDRRTKKKAIWKELTFFKGDVIETEDLEESRQRLMNMDLFSEVTVEEVGIELIGSVDIRITVKEKWSYLPLPVFSRNSDGETKAGFSYEDYNLWGRGQYLKLKWVKNWADEFGEYIGDDYSFKLSTYELTSKNIVISTRIEKKVNLEKTYVDGKEISAYRLDSDLYSLEVNRNYDHFYYGMNHGGSNDSYHYLSGMPRNYEDGHGRSIGIHSGYNAVDNLGSYVYKGYKLQFSISRNDKRLGADSDSTSYSMDYVHFIHMGGRKNLAYRINGGFAVGDSSENTEFDDEGGMSVGGASSLKGYEKSEFKGDRKFQINTEYRFPLTENYWGGAFFVDGAYAWPKGDALDVNDLKWGAGFSLRILIKQLVKGIGRIDFAYNLDRKETMAYMGVGDSF